MPERAHARVARAAIEVQPYDPRGRRRGRRMLRVRRAEEGHLRPAERRGDVHQAGIVADDECRAGDEVDGLIERRLADEVVTPDAGARLAVAARAQENDLDAEAQRQLLEVGPALG